MHLLILSQHFLSSTSDQKTPSPLALLVRLKYFLSKRHKLKPEKYTVSAEAPYPDSGPSTHPAEEYTIVRTSTQGTPIVYLRCRSAGMVSFEGLLYAAGSR